MNTETKIILKQKFWQLYFGAALLLLFVYGYVYLREIFDRYLAFRFLGPIIIVAIFVGIFFIMISYTDKVTVTDKKLEVVKLFILKKDYLIEDIDMVVVETIGGKSARYKGINIYVKGKNIWIFNRISERWKNFDELILFFKERSIPMEGEIY